jgi:hypothetical protein
MVQHLHFSVEGEFITNLARQLFYSEHKLDKAINIIKGATANDALSEIEHLQLCLEIIAGTKSIVGTYPGDDYGVIENKDATFNDFIKEFETLNEKYEKTQQELTDIYRKFAFLCDDMSDFQLKTLNREYYEEYGEYLFETSESERNFMECVMNTPVSDTSAIDSYLARKTDKTEYTYADYGWLEPDGTYHEVDWGEHSEWAREYADEHYPFSTHAHMYWKTNANGEREHYVCGDFLVYCLGWVLLDNPMQGIATPKYDMAKGLTKRQKEFLYDYYIERNMHDRANKLYEDD